MSCKSDLCQDPYLSKSGGGWGLPAAGMVMREHDVMLTLFITCTTDCTSLFVPPSPDLGRMYNLVSRIADGLGELKKLLETHIFNQGLAAIEKCGDSALNVSDDTPPRRSLTLKECWLVLTPFQGRVIDGCQLPLFPGPQDVRADHPGCA